MGEYKSNAPQLLEAALRKRRKRCVVATGSMCDPYTHAEAELKHTRKCLEVIEKYGFGLAILTKSDLILRDIDLLKSINAKAKCVVQMTLTTYDENLCKIIEPNVCTTKQRFAALCALRDAGIPTVVWLGPFLPFINDGEENLRGILDYCIRAGVKGIMFWGIGMTLRDGSREYFYQKLDEHFCGLSKKYHQKYGYSYYIKSDDSDRLSGIFRDICDRHGIAYGNEHLFGYMAAMPDGEAEQVAIGDVFI